MNLKVPSNSVSETQEMYPNTVKALNEQSQSKRLDGEKFNVP